MKVKVSEASGVVLDYLVAKCEGNLNRVTRARNFGELCKDRGGVVFTHGQVYTPSTNWAQGGPIIEREIFRLFKNVGGRYTAQIKIRIHYYSPTYDADIGADRVVSSSGDTPLVAAMRCYVASKMGDTVDIPDELLGTI